VKFIGIKVDEEEYDMFRRLAKGEGKSLSEFIRSKVKEAVKQEMKEINLLDRLIRLIEELPQKLQMQVRATNAGSNEEMLNQLARLLVYLIKLFEIYSEYTIVLPDKRKEFQARREELKRALGLEV
jgi:uncharacterized protein (DUF1778 family)